MKQRIQALLLAASVGAMAPVGAQTKDARGGGVMGQDKGGKLTGGASGGTGTAAAPGSPAAATPAGHLAYLPFIQPVYARALLRGSSLDKWQDQGEDTAREFARVRSGLMANLSMRLAARRALARGWDLRKLPLPVQNRITLNSLAKKAGFLPTLAEQTAFMAKVLRDQGDIRWVKLGGSGGTTQLGAVLQWPHTIAPKYPLNCAQYIVYTAYMTGLPRDQTTYTGLPQLDALSQDFQVADTKLLGDWRGYWKAVLDAQSHQPVDYKAAGYGVGDLALIFKKRSTRVSLTQPRVLDGFGFDHIEIFTKPTANHGDSESLGNYGSGPQFSELFGPTRRFDNWVTSDNTAERWKQTIVHEVRHVIFQFQEKPLPDTVALPPEAFP